MIESLSIAVHAFVSIDIKSSKKQNKTPPPKKKKTPKKKTKTKKKKKERNNYKNVDQNAVYTIPQSLGIK